MNRARLLTAWLLVGCAACSPAPPRTPAGPVQLGTVTDRHLNEISGLAASRRQPGILWVHNDGKDGRLVALATNGHALAAFSFPVEFIDWEDLALGSGPDEGNDYLYAGDIGDNRNRRGSVRVVRVSEPDLTSAGGAASTRTIPAEDVRVFTLQYPDTAHDAEALLIDPITGDLFVVTKERGRARLYGASLDELQESGPVRLELAVEVPCARVSGGDISADGQRILLRREDAAWLWMREPGESVASAFRRSPRSMPVVGPPEESNGEAVTWHPEGTGYYTLSEGEHPQINLFRMP
jgi:hypothetical protein